MSAVIPNTSAPRNLTLERHPQLVSQIQLDKLPRHIAFIMDGNRRWARDRGLHALVGHAEGVKTIREIAETALDVNLLANPEERIQHLTFYAFSKENWLRPVEEVSGLMEIFKKAAMQEIRNLHQRNIRVRIIGDPAELPKQTFAAIKEIVDLTVGNSGLTMNFALSYSGREEIVKAVKRLALDVRDAGLDPETIDVELFQKYLDTWDAPDPDFLIRTSGERRLSNFLLWQLAYTEIWVTDEKWPDFQRPNFLEALLDFQTRDRRYGKQ
ncbi:MAG: Ditrans,polycis-undecaprenyl-diphosphate synthase ((2E,6E)-farnesyl-diphosphate specific) [bacterium]|nr:Ditrans,polycis-undecaprenyl-diphosphate synthase ((2E,6E)-farnesyl-diphosphate specific) [bacterium]